MNDESVKQLIREFILTECLPGESPSNLKDDTPLSSGGIIDSLAALHLVTFVEERFAIEVEAQEAGADHFDTIERIAHFIQQKRTGAA